MKKAIVIILILITGLLYFFDFGFIKGEITEYSMLCDRDKYIDYECSVDWLTLNTTTYKPNVSKQYVLSWGEVLPGIKKLDNCSVINRKNWTCKYSDEGLSKFGFKDGKYWEFMPDYESINIYKFVSKFGYRLAEISLSN